MFSWVCRATESAPAPATNASASPYRESNAGDVNEHPQKKLFVGLCAVFNIGLSFMIACTGALAVGSANSANDTGAVFVGLYMVGFSAILFIYEALQLTPLESLDNIFKQNFGFLYGNLGKSCYLLL
mgnify:FL=1